MRTRIMRKRAKITVLTTYSRKDNVLKLRTALSAHSLWRKCSIAPFGHIQAHMKAGECTGKSSRSLDTPYTAHRTEPAPPLSKESHKLQIARSMYASRRRQLTSTTLCDYRAAKQLLGVNSSISGYECVRRPTCNHLQVEPHCHLASEPQILNTRDLIVIRVYPAIILGRHNHIRMHFAPCQTLSLYLSSALQLHNNARKLLRNFRRLA